MTTRCVLVHYDEVVLKGRNRPWFVDMLVRHVREQTRGLGVLETRPFKGRIELVLHPDADEAAIAARLAATFGVATFGPALRCPASLDDILASVTRIVARRAPAPFRVRARRADKRFPIPSPEMERIVGAHVHERWGWPVNLRTPATVIGVEVVPGAAYCWVDRHRGPGGLPVGSSARVLALLSGGADSAVAAWRMMRRGCRLDAVTFHSHPVTPIAAVEAVRRVVARLACHQGRMALAVVPLLDVQKRIAAVAPPPLRTVLYRRAMVRLATRLASRHRAEAIVTGDVLGQVASQTAANLRAVDQASRLPVWRPLLGHDKAEILRLAEARGLRAHEGWGGDECCRVFAPKIAATRTVLDRLVALEQAADLGPAETEAVSSTVWEIVEADWTAATGSGRTPEPGDGPLSSVE